MNHRIRLPLWAEEKTSINKEAVRKEMPNMKQETAIIIGAGPAGLTAALELENRTAVRPVVLESMEAIGGLSRTVRYKGNRMDIGPHRFFSKSDRVMQWWLNMMPIEGGADQASRLRYHGQERNLPAAGAGPDPQKEDLVMLVLQRKTRIYFLRRFFDYPIRLSAATIRNLGLWRTLVCGLSYLRAALMPRRQEVTLEDFLVNRFGRQLYRTFFESYTEKVWGVPCRQISAEWGAQRIKGLSLKGVVAHFFRKLFARSGDLAQKKTETSLIEQFLYPKLGAGQLWEHVAGLVKAKGGEFKMGITIDRIHIEGNRVAAVEGTDAAGNRVTMRGDYFFSTMPVRDLIRAMGAAAPAEVVEVAEGLVYRDMVIVGLLVDKLAVKEKDGAPLRDNWIYIQEPDVTVGRLQILNNWGSWLVGDPGKYWLGLEYFCNVTDPMWKYTDEEMVRLGVEEMERIGIVKAGDVLDSHVVRVPKTYPAYFGTYARFDTIRNFLDGIENLFLVGRNGMHKYNNQDHSMLTAMTAVDNIANGITTKDNIWAINTEAEYHEEKSKA